MSSLISRTAHVEIVSGNVTTRVEKLTIPTNYALEYVKLLVTPHVPAGNEIYEIKLLNSLSLTPV